MNNELITVSGYSAAVLLAEMHTPKKRPGSKKIDPYPKITWEEASEEMQNDPKVLWINSPSMGKHTYRRCTPEEKEEIRLNQIWRVNQQAKYLLEHYGWEYAERFARKRENITEIDFSTIPHCQYTIDKQCDLFCPFFKGYCEYKEEENDNNL